MKNAQRKDFSREIRKSLNRYLSLLFIVALGVAFFCGVRSAEPDMRLSADRYYDQTNFMDIRVLGTLGVTDDDLQAIEAIDGVACVEGISTLEALASSGEQEYVLQVSALPEQISRPSLTAGRMPEADNECVLDDHLQSNYALGDTLTIYGSKDTDLTESLAETSYTIVGFVNSPHYLSFDRGTASIGNGTCNGLLFIPQTVFITDYYTAIYATVTGAAELTALTDDYEDLVRPITDKIEQIADARCQARYDSVMAEAEEELEKGQKELADAELEAEQELGDALQKLQDGETDLANGKETLAKKEQELADGKAEIADAEKQLKEARQKLADGKRQYYQGKAELTEKEAQLTDAKRTLAEQEASLLSGWEQYQEGMTQYEGGMAQLDSLKSNLTALEAGLTAQGIDPSGNIDCITLQQTISMMEPQLNAAGTELNTTYTTLMQAQVQIDAAEAELTAGEEQLTAGKQQLAAAWQEIKDSQSEIDSANDKLADAKTEVTDGEQQMEDAQQEIKDAEQELADGWKEYEEGKQEADEKIADAKVKLADAKAEIAAVKFPEWFVLNRNSIQSYVEYGQDAERIGNIGKVFPAIFFLVAALVSLTTMTRMVEEQRTQIGTLKALGYSKFSIAQKFLLYALSASLLGSLLGILVGSQLLPRVIMSAYHILYVTIEEQVSPIQPDYALISTALAVFCTTGATLAACYKELAATPADLMRPAAPKQGKRVFFERIPFLWRRLSFSSKATIRNLIRYKKRFFMTVFGIGSCMALLMVGFGLRDSISKIVDNQYQTVWTYQAYLDLDTEENTAGIQTLVQQNSNIEESLAVYQATKDVECGSVSKSAYLMVPQNLAILPDFVQLKNRTSHETYTLRDDGVILTEKLARMLGVSVGDTFQIAASETEKYSVTVTAITENYLQHYVYMTPALYESLYGHEPEYNRVLFSMESISAEQENVMAQELLAQDAVLGISFVRDLQENVGNMMRSLDLVIWVLILSAGLLAFVVLYNLNNINITERRRELATIKVLGFYDGEVAGYVYRENVLLTLIGILIGIVLGIFLHKFVIQTVEVEMLMFGQTIHPISYVLSALLTILFSVLVNVSMFYKLRKIDMIESLKSVE